MLKHLKRRVRQVGHRFNLLTDWEQVIATLNAPGTEMPPRYYDDVYRSEVSYHIPFYESPYYAMWSIIVDRLQRYEIKAILDIGCGTGQFAELVADWGFKKYSGVDFSAEAIRQARERVPHFAFRAADATKAKSFDGIDYDAVVCMEVLEHIDNDFALVSSIKPGARCLATVPNFPWESHVRHFSSTNEVEARYGQFFDELSITRIKGTRGPTEEFFLLDGIRKSKVSVSG
jgi:2-polyprenyl-3-methyl-5-hydroxy-6-metoxy-1,4-benzoquinol methylase